MPVLIAALLGGLASTLTSIVGRVLLALGIGYATYTGLTHGTDFILLQMKQNYAGFSGEIGSFLSWLYVDKALSMIASSFTAAFAIRTSTGAITKMVIKK